VTFGQAFQKKFVEVFLVKMREGFTQASDKKLIGEFGQLKGFEQPLLGSHPTEHFKVYLMIWMFLNTYHCNYQ